MAKPKIWRDVIDDINDSLFTQFTSIVLAKNGA